MFCWDTEGEEEAAFQDRQAGKENVCQVTSWSKKSRHNSCEMSFFLLGRNKSKTRKPKGSGTPYVIVEGDSRFTEGLLHEKSGSLTQNSKWIF